MDLGLKDKLFVVTGATSGFGKAIADGLVNEGANVIINARGEEKLIAAKAAHSDQIDFIAGDITSDATISALINMIGDKKLDGILINAGGPPAKSFVATELGDWDDAYKNILRWKVKLTQALLPKLMEQSYGRIVYIESASVKQPIENLVLSNSLRLAVVGFVKTMSREIGSSGVTCNIIAPGYHATPAMERLFAKKSELDGITADQAKDIYINQTKVGSLGDAQDLASLAVWLLSPGSGYVTGQTIAVDGGLVSNTL